MKYDFDKIIDRRNTYCLKYDHAAERGKPQGVLPLWVADMDISAPPQVIAALKNRAKHGVFGYTMPKREYFEAVSAWFSKRHGWQTDPDKFICTPGVVFALCTLIRAVTREGDGVICCQPVYYPFMDAVINNNRKLVVSELKNDGGKYRVDFDDFESKIEEGGVKAFILCNPHNPVGRVWTREELKKLGDICAAHGVFVISDEIHADFVFGANKHLPFPSANPGYEENCAVCTSPSKTFNLAGLQISDIYIPSSAVRKKFEAELDKTGYWEPNVMGLTACEAAYRRCGGWLDGLLEYLKGNIDYAFEYVSRNLAPVTLRKPEGTYLLWLDFRGLSLSDDGLNSLMVNKAGLWLDDGNIFGAGGRGFQRMNIACPRATVTKALENIRKALDR